MAHCTVTHVTAYLHLSAHGACCLCSLLERKNTIRNLLIKVPLACSTEIRDTPICTSTTPHVWCYGWSAVVCDVHMVG
jgi:hypothetical protein